MHGDALSAMQRAVKGTVNDRPWGVTLAGLGLGSRTGQLTLRAEGKAYRIAFFRGAIVGASSPLAVDSVARIALTSRMIPATQVEELKQRVKAAPDRDEVDVLAEAVSLSAEQAEQLRQRVLVQRAARTFAVDLGDYVLEERISLLGVEGSVDVRAAIYLGVRMNLSQQRLALDLRQLGTTFVLPSNAELAPFDFTEEEGPILAALRLGTSLAEFEATHRDFDPRTAQAVVYALAACDAILRVEPQEMSVARTPTPREPTMSRVPTPREPTVSRVPTPRQPTTSRAETDPSEPTRTRVPTPRQPSMSRTESATMPAPRDRMTTTYERGPAARVHPHTRPRVARTMTEPFVLHPTTVRPKALSVPEIEVLIAQRTALLERGTDHFELLGLPLGASIDEVHAAYVELARYLEPKRLAEFGIRDREFAARQLFAQICIAVTVLTDPARRADYVGTLTAR